VAISSSGHVSVLTTSELSIRVGATVSAIPVVGTVGGNKYAHASAMMPNDRDIIAYMTPSDMGSIFVSILMLPLHLLYTYLAVVTSIGVTYSGGNNALDIAMATCSPALAFLK